MQSSSPLGLAAPARRNNATTAADVSRLMVEHLEHIRTDWHAAALAAEPVGR